MNAGTLTKSLYKIVSSSNDDVESEFFAFPYQPYYARMGNISATVSDFLDTRGSKTVKTWGVNVYRCRVDGSGKSDPIDHFDTTDQDAAFIFAADKLNTNA